MALKPFEDNFEKLLKKHSVSAKKKGNTAKATFIDELLREYAKTTAEGDELKIIRTQDAFDKYLLSKLTQFNSLFKERERTVLMGNKLEAFCYKLLKSTAEEFGLWIGKTSVLSWVGFAPKDLTDEEFKLKKFRMSADIAIGKEVKLKIGDEEKEELIPLVFISCKEMIEFYILRQLSKEAENAKISNPNLLFLVACHEEQIGEDKKNLMNLWLKDTDGLFIFRDCRRHDSKPLNKDIIKKFKETVYSHLNKLNTGELHIEKVNLGIKASTF